MKSYITIALFLFVSLISVGQCDEIAKSTEASFTADYISDGQTYRALLVDDQMAEFSSIFFGGTTYRIAAASSKQKGITFNVLDQSRNVLFSSADYENTEVLGQLRFSHDIAK